MTTTYYDYEAQQWKSDIKGFVSFHVNELDFLTSCENSIKGNLLHIKHHAEMLIQAGQKSELSDFVLKLIN